MLALAPPQTIGTGYENVMYTTVLQIGQHVQPEVCHLFLKITSIANPYVLPYLYSLSWLTPFRLQPLNLSSCMILNLSHNIQLKEELKFLLYCEGVISSIRRKVRFMLIAFLSPHRFAISSIVKYDSVK